MALLWLYQSSWISATSVHGSRSVEILVLRDHSVVILLIGRRKSNLFDVFRKLLHNFEKSINLCFDWRERLADSKLQVESGDIYGRV